MAISIYADAKTDLEFDAESREFVAPRTPPIGPIFTIRALDYWHTQIEQDTASPESVRKQMAGTIEHCLVAIDGDPALAARFKAAPAGHVVGPLFVACVGHTLGN